MQHLRRIPFFFRGLFEEYFVAGIENLRVSDRRLVNAAVREDGVCCCHLQRGDTVSHTTQRQSCCIQVVGIAFFLDCCDTLLLQHGCGVFCTDLMKGFNRAGVYRLLYRVS